MAVAKKILSDTLDIGIEAKKRKAVAEALKSQLADTYLLQLKTKFYHWNVTGAQFFSLHTLFDKQYEALSAAVDELAERIRSLGFAAPGTFREFLELTALAEDKSLPENWEKMVQNLVSDHETLIRSAREKVALAQEQGDEGTADIFIKRIQEHEKAAWFLRSHF